MTNPLDPRAQDVLDFWFSECKPADWFSGAAALDRSIRDRYRDLWRAARHGDLDDWQNDAKSCLALIIILDQFSRNIFRGRPDAFAADAQALKIARHAISRLLDEPLDRAERQFMYMPLMHSEQLADQDMCCDLFRDRLGNDPELSRHAHEHRDVILRFGRFPHRNPILGRTMTADEQAFLDETGWSP